MGVIAIAAGHTAFFEPSRFGLSQLRATDFWRHHGPERRYLQGLVALVVAYYATAHIGYAFSFSGPVASLVWLPVGVGIAFLYLGGIRFWPGVVIGDLLVNNYGTLPVGSALAQSVGNVLEVIVAAWLLRRMCPRDEPLGSLRAVFSALAALAIGTLVSATVGSVASWLGGVVDAHSLPYVWRTWWLGDFSGAIVVVPLVLSWSTLPARPWHRERLISAAWMLATVVALSAFQLGHTTMLWALVFPALIWAALGFGQRGATLAIAIVCGFTVWGTTNDLGPFAVGTISARLLETQVFIATVSLSALVIAALVAERARLEDGVRGSRARLVAASDVARRHLERDLHDGAQQGIIGLRLKLVLAADAIDEDPAEGKRLVQTIARQMDDVVESVRSIAGGVYSTLLHENGITDALKSTAFRATVPVSVHAERIERYAETIECAVYFCCLEALQNVTKHAGVDAHATISLRQAHRAVLFEVVDSGVGFDSRTVRAGDGLANMRDRVEAVGGALSVTSKPGTGTTVRGRVPIA
jgi:signal transduction histidine kinase